MTEPAQVSTPFDTPLPAILAGPILRHVSPDTLIVWLVCSEACHVTLQCYEQDDYEDKLLAEAQFAPHHEGYIRLAEHVHLHLLVLKPQHTFPQDKWLSYDVGVEREGKARWLQELLPHILYDDEPRPCFVIKSYLNQILHGSCRRPHYHGSDGMLEIDRALHLTHTTRDDLADQPALLLLTGDQVYMDDVAGPMLLAIHQVIKKLGFPREHLSGSRIKDSHELHRNLDAYYHRAELLPELGSDGRDVKKTFFTSSKKPIFTSSSADNHLISLAEMMTMYLLVWSPQLWAYADLDSIRFPDEKRQQRYEKELPAIKRLRSEVATVQRVLANLPVYMIFDDHDITDDWNLSRKWEENAYGHPFSKRIIGNALIAYLVCQGWGNAPQNFPEAMLNAIRYVVKGNAEYEHEQLVIDLIAFNGWEYKVQTEPPIVVIDSRTRRWRSDRKASQPSGLLDWEGLMDLQQALLGHDKGVILVSPAPIFGVKIIEVVQRFVTLIGYPLLVDAENWMAHRKAAYTILSIFRHRRTPHNFVILSGDVHYSFVYDVRIRHHEKTPHIWQITSSGIKNEFPPKLLRFFDRLNRILFFTYSPLNWLTRRRDMRIRQRRVGQFPTRYKHQRLLNGSGIGRVWLDDQGAPEKIEELQATDLCIPFYKGYNTDWVD